MPTPLIRYFGLLLLCIFSSTYAADLPIGAVSLSLGMEQSTVMKELRAHFHVVAVTGNSNMFFLSESKPPNASVIGGVSFENGRLAWIQRNWGSFAGKVNSIEVTKALVLRHRERQDGFRRVSGHQHQYSAYSWRGV